MDIVGTKSSTPSVFVNPTKHNIGINKKTGHRRFYMNDKGLEKFKVFILEQWGNNLKKEHRPKRNLP